MTNNTHQIDRFRETAPADIAVWFDKQLKDETFASQLNLVWTCSEFAANSCIQQPALLHSLVESGDLANHYSVDHYQQSLQDSLSACDSEEDLHRLLRQFRRREQVRLVWRDFTRLADMTETTADASRLADACINGALDFLYHRACRQWGVPLGEESHKPQQMLVLGMGKLGAYELNLSSDIDLIFAYPEAGETELPSNAAGAGLSNQEFFVRLGKKLIQALDNQTADGFVFRVDMRLRPYGQSGALVLNFDALEEYYQTQGREWERYAMIKARVVAGDTAAGRELMTILRPFTYRKYIDFSVIQALRDMKALINREVQRKGMQQDIKRGAGGIREVEFIAQAFQLIRGGRDTHFQTPALCDVLSLLAEEEMLPKQRVRQLREAYQFLRNTEHALQGWRDQQTQQLPADSNERQRIARVLGYDRLEDFDRDLAQHRSHVREVFEQVAAEREHKAPADNEQQQWLEQAAACWQLAQLQAHQTDPEQHEARRKSLARAMEKLGYNNSLRAADLLLNLQQDHAIQAMEASTRKRLDVLMPLLLTACLKDDSAGKNGVAHFDPAETLARTLVLVEAVARRSAYLLLLTENPMALEQFVRLCAASPMIASQLTLMPALLDELLDPRTLYQPPDRDRLVDELRQEMLRIPPDDLEAQIEALHYFHQAHSLRVAACEVVEVMPLMKVSDYLSWLAEAILEYVLSLAWGQMVAKHGRPGAAATEPESPEPAFLIVGYGKLGGIELGHNSDLDMVFIHDADMGLVTDGDRSIDNATFFARLGQRIIHILTARTSSGALYEVDMRLRPSGNSGMLVTSLDAFEKYQSQTAWTWEHQALVRARPVAGDKYLAEKFQAIRRRVLQQPRDLEALKEDVRKMRRKMLDHLGSKPEVQSIDEYNLKQDFNLKQDRGGIVDIEFMVQFAVLAWSRDNPALTHWSDNIRLLDDLEKSAILSQREAADIREAYKAFRAAGHRLQLQQQPGVVRAEDFVTQRQAVCRLWQKMIGEY